MKRIFTVGVDVGFGPSGSGSFVGEADDEPSTVGVDVGFGPSGSGSFVGVAEEEPFTVGVSVGFGPSGSGSFVGSLFGEAEGDGPSPPGDPFGEKLGIIVGEAVVTLGNTKELEACSAGAANTAAAIIPPRRAAPMVARMRVFGLGSVSLVEFRSAGGFGADSKTTGPRLCEEELPP